ncbi:LrgB family protein [Glaciimonas immobilis]|uniref:Putative murein hydrolase (TIGR00659 family) n=1 Tax=Glaciimonas immobilis TaxID=728004 RepID=A0A840RQL5_9BURK|nr:LrgB family protein [Glaciimonas immobilis]KAF3999301.1 LrgB family protein [Glaciimonas immobilis]MBB5198779.1 putative murein hydrolase (TIGR00659 family) [Glaciimonas immobilis]
MHNIAQLGTIWVYLAGSPLLGLTLTLCAYTSAFWVYSRCKFSPLANPVAIAIALIVVILKSTGMSYQDYFSGAQFVHFLLGPATVALAIPLARQLPRLRRSFVPLVCGLFTGSVTAIISAVAIIVLMGGSYQLAISIGPKSATTPIAMGVAEKLGGLPALTAVLVIGTGIFGAVIGRFLFNWMRIDSHEVRGFALGVTSHGIGTARAFQVSAEMGAFAGLGMGMNGVLTAFLAPWLIPILINNLSPFISK